MSLEAGTVEMIVSQLLEAFDKAMAQPLRLRREIVEQIKKKITKMLAEQDSLRSFYYETVGRQ